MEFLNDSVSLSRCQFALTAMFHILWPVLTIGLSLFLVTAEALWMKTGDVGFNHYARFWSKLLLLNFAIGVVSGLLVRDGGFAGGMWSWLGVFSSVVALGVAAGYALLEGTFLVIKTHGELQATSRRRSSQAAWIILVAAAYVTVATTLYYGYVAHRMVHHATGVFPCHAAAGGTCCLCTAHPVTEARGRTCPFAWSTVIFMVSFVGLAASLYPYLVPPSLSLAGAASSSSTLVFMLAGIGMLIPVMLVYNGFQYLVFHGKILQERPEPGSPPGNTSRNADYPDHA